MYDNFKGIVETGCPLCDWFGVTGAHSTHWKRAHSLLERACYHVLMFFGGWNKLGTRI